MTQAQALTILKTGANVFLTGEPGSGKTHTVNEYVKYLRARNIQPAITASTGIAATHINGMTIHSWSGIGIKTQINKYELRQIATTERIVERVSNAQVLIIDEISMLPPKTLGMVDAVCREIKNNPQPFGGIQVVLVGDFFQLPPIIKTEPENNKQTTLAPEPVARFAYDSGAWEKINPTICYLTEQHRQDDPVFLNLLGAIRRNLFNDHHLDHLQARKIDSKTAPKDAPKLFSHNFDVDYVNEKVLAKLPNEPKIFKMSSAGSKNLVLAMKKSCLSPEMLYLKIGAAVMFTKNNQKDGFVNGTLGIVAGFEPFNGYPIVKLRNGKRIEVKPMKWTIEENGDVRAQITQIPLRLAWAITIHKSQGISLDEAVMDLSQVFEFGQGYVALSRVRRLAGLYLLGWNSRAFQVHPEVLSKDEKFRAQSAETMRASEMMAKDEISTKHEQFIQSCGGINTTTDCRQSFSENFSSSGFTKIPTAPWPNGKSAGRSEKHPNAYLPWDEAQDDKLQALYLKGSSLTNLTQTFNRTKGAIRSRLTKLGLLLD